ncbi:MAG TPA: DNA primase [Terriglobales bacterium]|nr:DNA primase [Terriglobales bacterium]
MPTPGSFADSVKQQADIVRIVGGYVKLKKAGAQNFSGLCPFHNEKTPSFSVHATRQFFHCFGCGVSGDVFSFVQKIENITFPEAVRAVAEKSGIAIPKQAPSTPAEAKEAQLRGKLVELHERACAFFEEQLQRPEAAGAREYLAGRGLNPETIKQFRMGFAPESGFLLRDRLNSTADEETLKASGLLSWKDSKPDRPGSAAQEKNAGTLYSRFRNRIMFPIASESGKVIAFTGRSLAADERSGPKYLNSPETAIYSKSRVLFNLDRAREHIRALDYAILVEGQMDCISVFAAGFRNVIASSGTAFTEAQVRLLGRYSRNIIVNFDPDAAGAAAAERSLALLVAEDFRIKVLTLEPGFDPDLFIRRKGREAYAAALKAAPDYFDYLIEQARAKFRVNTADGKVQAVNFLLPHFQRVSHRIKRDELLANVAQKLTIDSALLRQELKTAVTTRAAAVKAPSERQLSDAEKIFLRALTDADPQLREKANEALAAHQLHRGLESEHLVEALLGAATEGEFDVSALELPDSDRQLLAAVLMHEGEELNAALLEKAERALHRRQLERKQRALKAEIADAERKRDQTALARLVQEKLTVDRALATHN